MQISLPSKLIFTLVGLTLPVAAHKADMNETHIYNPKWPPHAKFHDGQTLSFSIALGGLTTFLAWRSTKNERMSLNVLAGASSLYFVTQSSAILYPGTAYVDPEFKTSRPSRIPAAVIIDTVYLTAIGLAYWLGRRALERAEPRGEPCLYVAEHSAGLGAALQHRGGIQH